jgi:hypothetical protein
MGSEKVTSLGKTTMVWTWMIKDRKATSLKKITTRQGKIQGGH